MTDQLIPGDRVRVRTMFPPGHIRTPYFVRGHIGQVERLNGLFANPEQLAYARDGLPKIPLYRVRFYQRELWPDYSGPATDTLTIDLYAHWLEKINEGV